jgi:hypothetical protein
MFKDILNGGVFGNEVIHEDVFIILKDIISEEK